MQAAKIRPSENSREQQDKPLTRTAKTKKPWPTAVRQSLYKSEMKGIKAQSP